MTRSPWRRPLIAAVVSILLIQTGAAAPASVLPAEQPLAFDPVEARSTGPPVAPIDVETDAEVRADTGEIDHMRTESSRTFDNGDGTFTTEVFTDPFFYRPDTETDDWQPIEVGFEAIDGARAESDLVAASTKAPVQVSIGANKRSDGFLVLEAGGRTYAISLTAADASRASLKAPTIDDARADWSDFLPGVDLRVIAGAEGAKTFLILDEPPATPEWTFLIDAPGLTAELAVDGSVGFFDGKEQVAWIPAPYAVDSSQSAERGGGEMTDQVSLDLQQAGDQIALTIRVDRDWLAKATYPVFVDPSFSDDFFPSTTTYGDAFVSTKYPTMNFADYVRPDSPYYHEHWLGMDPTNSSNVNKVLMRFDLDELDDATIDLARLWIYPYHQYYNAPTATTTWINRITGSWAENTVTESNQPGSSCPCTSASFVEGDYDYFTLTGLVQDWADGTYPNYGVKLHENGNNGTYWKRLISYEQGGSQAQYRPMLEVTWHFPVGTPSNPTGSEWTKNRTLSWSYSDSEGASQSHFQVQVDNNSNFSSPLSSSGTVASSSYSWAIPGGVSLTTGTTYYWRVKVKNGTGWSAWSSGAAFRWDEAPPGYAPPAPPAEIVTGAITAADPNYYELGDGSVTIKIRGDDDQSGVRITYLRLFNATDEMRVKHDWAIGGTHCDEFITSTLVDATACAETYSASGTREVTFTVVGLNQSTSFDIQWYFTDYAGNASLGYTPTGKNLILDATAPTASITAPADDAVVSGVVDVVGTAADVNFHRYMLVYGAGESPPSWSEIDAGTSPVTNGTLGSWDTASVPNGEYTIRLSVYDKARISSGYTTVLRHVIVDNGGATADITDPAESDHVRGTISIVGTAAADSGFSSYSLEYGSGCVASSWDDIGSNPRTSPVTEDTLGSWDTSTVADGDYTIRLTTERTGLPPVSDAVCVRIDNTDPTAAITSPVPDEEVSDPVSVVGTADDANFTSYTLDFGEGTAPTTWEPIGTNPRTVAVVSDELGTWDISALSTGTYTIRLRVFDIAGGSSDFAEVTRQVTVPLNPNADIELEATNMAVGLLPHLDLQIGTNDAVVPGAQVTYDVEVGHGGGTIQVGATLTAENSGDVPLVVESFTAVIETRAVGSGTWEPLAAYDLTAPGWTAVNPAPSAPNALDVEADSIEAAGVEYPFDFPAILGTEVEPGSTATWNLGVYLGLEPEVLEELLDDGATAEIRHVLWLEVSPRDAQLGQPFSITTDLTSDIQSADPSLSDVTFSVQPPSGSPTLFDAASHPPLASLALDDPPLVEEVPYAVPGSTQRGPTESVDDYLQRLKDFGIQTATAVGDATTDIGSVMSEAQHESVDGVPILLADFAGDAGATGGTTLVRSLTLTNVGGARADDISVIASVGGTVSGSIIDLGSVLNSGASDDGDVEFSLPANYTEGTDDATIELTWVDASLHEYGPLEVSEDVWISNGAAGAPTVDVATPEAVLFGDEPIAVTAGDDVAVTLVELLIDQVVVVSASSEPFLVDLDTAALSDGDHVMSVRVHDGSNTTTSIPMNVAVNNQLPSAERIRIDRVSERLTIDEAAMHATYSATGSSQLPSRYQGPSTSADTDGTDLLQQIYADWESLQTQTRVDVTDLLADHFAADPGGHDPFGELAGFGEYCTVDGSCAIESDHFHVRFYIGQGEDVVAKVDLVSADLEECDPPPDPTAGACNHVPDDVDRLVLGLEHAREFYTDELGYALPETISIHVLDMPDHRSMAWPTFGIEADAASIVQIPFEIARHELFHLAQYEQLTLAEIGFLFGRQGVWWLEASANWATHQAVVADPGLSDVPLGYAEPTWRYLSSTTLGWDNTTSGRHYGEFLLAEFLEEWFGDGDFGGTDDLEADHSVILQTWSLLGTGLIPPTASEAIIDVIESNGGSAESVISAFGRANYLLDATVQNERVGGTYRDSHVEEWRESLDADEAATRGDEEEPMISGEPRPARIQGTLPGARESRWSDPLWARLEPGGAAYFELLMPIDAGNAYWIEVRAAGEDRPVVAMAVPIRGADNGDFETDYPTPCLSDVLLDTANVDGDTVASGRVVLPDECGLITLIVSHVDPVQDTTFDVQVTGQSGQVMDDFERTRLIGWGLAANEWRWRDGDRGPVDGSAGDGSGHLVLDGSLDRAHLDFTAGGITEVVLIAKFSDCSDPDQFIGLGVEEARPVFLRSNGLLFSGTSTAVVPDFDPCEPWFIRYSGDSVKAWQAIHPEPEDWMVESDNTDRNWKLDIMAVTIGGTAGELLVEVLDIDWESG